MRAHFDNENAGKPRIEKRAMREFPKRAPRNRTRECHAKLGNKRLRGRHSAMQFSRNAASKMHSQPPLYMGGRCDAAVPGLRDPLK